MPIDRRTQKSDLEIQDLYPLGKQAWSWKIGTDAYRPGLSGYFPYSYVCYPFIPCRCCKLYLDARDPAELMRHLVARGMSHLHTSQWSSQKAGVAILCSLAQTCTCNFIFLCSVRPTDSRAGFGVEALKQAIPEVAKMILLPRIQNSNGQPAVTIPQTGQRTPSSLFGPALVLHVLAENGRQMIST